MRVVPDPNMLISAALSPNGVPAQIISAARQGRVQLVMCPHLVEELHEVLVRPRFRRWVSIEQVHRYVSDLTALGEPQPDPQPPYPINTRDPTDDYLVVLALLTGADALVSGDQDLTTLNQPIVLTPRQLLDHLQSGSA